MLNDAGFSLLASMSLISTVIQMFTATIAVTIGVITYRYTKRQSALTLINHNNTLANAVNSTLIASPEARTVLGRLQNPIVGAPDDAVLFMYLNYVHNTFRMRQINAVTAQVWHDTLGACATLLAGLRREQVVRLVSRGYEARFQVEMLERFDGLAPATDAVVTLRRAA